MQTISYKGHVFEILNYIPLGYEIWNIHMIDGFLPLCKKKLEVEQPFKGATEIETNTLKAVPCKDAQIILAAVCIGPKTIKAMESYVKRYNKTRNAVTRQHVLRIKAALPVMYQLTWE